MTRSIAIIGGGIAGLGGRLLRPHERLRCRHLRDAQPAGRPVHLLARRDYVLDGCLTYLFGSGPGQPFHRFWKRSASCRSAGSTTTRNWCASRATRGRELIVWADPDRLEAHMTELSPADAGRIRAFCQGIRVFARFDMSVLQQNAEGPDGPAGLGTPGREDAAVRADHGAVLHPVRQGVRRRLSRPIPAASRSLHVRLARRAGDGRPLPAGLHAHGQRRLPGRRVAGPGPGRGGALPASWAAASTTTRRWKRSWSRATGPWASGSTTTRCTAPTSWSPPPTAGRPSLTCWTAST